MEMLMSCYYWILASSALFTPQFPLMLLLLIVDWHGGKITLRRSPVTKIISDKGIDCIIRKTYESNILIFYKFEVMKRQNRFFCSNATFF
ncbi:hypothetical protein OIU74_015851 [Salix koriyanagi]|uniref:Uncharacterized protein n=1 Tax=Salix koriyanagi TaxID=2511006 RepID=A0A9Q0PN16_9ROSI|nr:hypothetical protein OIU74_015851 [Salix koriyanagi]